MTLKVEMLRGRGGGGRDYSVGPSPTFTHPCVVDVRPVQGPVRDVVTHKLALLVRLAHNLGVVSRYHVAEREER